MTVNVTPITPADLQRELAQHPDTVVIDVRTPGEFEAQHIAGSYNVPLDLIQEHAAEVAARLDGKAVLVCQSGSRAGTALDRLAEAGFTQARVLRGGIGAYAQAGGRVSGTGSRWSMERQVRMTAGSLALAGAVASQLGPKRFGLVPAAIGAGLSWSAVSNTCAMASVLSTMPWNRPTEQRSADQVLGALPGADADGARG
ncbi:rhodanese-like domain-containing protein [Micrococcus porci]|uniref:rhodanese-like domain-containing protein n=1 Tax=Micrococcus TaxID=1269 RepID=UPI001CCA462F|nr:MULTISPECIES: rhodanese-like domain-containing protein [Micrococcus]MCG7423017.1 rhodanese-like domain-containing protein [Micrococcus sp. ACRRV]UBH25122.1 rhodanese-like domain-containing protein [Micrococcus porci]